MYDDILLPTDGSPGTVDALEHAVSIAIDQDARVHALYVVNKRVYLAADDETKEEVRQSFQEEGDRALEDARVRIEDEGAAVTTECLEGIPHKAITNYAEEEGIDLIVMGTHGQTGPNRVANLGSTTERVVKNGNVPVLVVDIG